MYLTILPASRSLDIDMEDQTHVECSFDAGSTFYELLENLPIRQPGASRFVAVCDFPDEVHVGVLHHDVEVLHGVDGFQLGPVFEPDDLGTG